MVPRKIGEGALRRDRQTWPAQIHQLEDLRRIDALRARNVMQEAEHGVTRRELLERVPMFDVPEPAYAERFHSIERGSLGLHDAADEPHLQEAGKLGLPRMKPPHRFEERSRARQAEDGSDVRGHEA